METDRSHQNNKISGLIVSVDLMNIASKMYLEIIKNLQYNNI